MIWAKTEAGRHEMQARALVKERARRNLLLLIDGVKSEDSLLSSVGGVDAADFAALQALGLIVARVAAPFDAEAIGASAQRPGGSDSAAAGGPSASSPAPSPSPRTASATVSASSSVAPAEASGIDRMRFTAALTKLISSELGLRGFVLTLAVEKAASVEELERVAQRTLDQVRDRHGEAAAAAARQTLYGA